MRGIWLVALVGCGFNGGGSVVHDATNGGGGGGSGSGSANPEAGQGNPEAGQQSNPEAGVGFPEAGPMIDAPNGCNFATIELSASIATVLGGVSTAFDDTHDFTDKQPQVELPGTLVVVAGNAASGCGELDIKDAQTHGTLRCRYVGGNNGAAYAFDGCTGGAACPSQNGATNPLQPGAKIKLEEITTLHLDSGANLTTTKATATLAQCDDGD